MAKVEVTPAVVETKVVEVEPAKVTLELTMDEASALHALLAKSVGGNNLIPLYRSLTTAGVKVNKYRVSFLDARSRMPIAAQYPRFQITERLGMQRKSDDEW